MAVGTYARTPEIRAKNRANAHINGPCPDDCHCGKHRPRTDAIAATNQYGPGRRLALNSKRLLNALNIVDDKLVTLMFREASHIMSIFPGTIEPNGGPVVPPDTDSSALLIGIRK